MIIVNFAVLLSGPVMKIWKIYFLHLCQLYTYWKLHRNWFMQERIFRFITIIDSNLWKIAISTIFNRLYLRATLNDFDEIFSTQVCNWHKSKKCIFQMFSTGSTKKIVNLTYTIFLPILTNFFKIFFNRYLVN